MKKKDSFKRRQDFRVIALLESTVQSVSMNRNGHSTYCMCLICRTSSQDTSRIQDNGLGSQIEVKDLEYDKSWHPNSSGSWKLQNEGPRDPLELDSFFANLRQLASPS